MAIKIYIQKRPSIVVQVGAKVINAGGGGVQTVTGDGVNNTDPLNPVLTFPTPAQIGAPSGSGSSTGTNTGDQTITLTGDVTGSGTGTFAATIANDAVTFAKMQNISTGHLIGRHAAGNGDPELIGLDGGVEFQGGKLRAKVANSVELNGGNIQLLNDSASPGNSKYYGTNAAGNKGFHDLAVNAPQVLYCSTTPVTFTGVLTTETTIHEIQIPTNIGNGYLYIRYNIKIQTAVSGAGSTSRVRIGNVGSNPFTDTLLATNAGTTVSNIDIYRHTPLIGGASGNIKRSTPQGGNVRNDDSAIGIYLDTVNVDWTVAKSIKLSCFLANAGNVVISDGALVVFYPEKL